MTRPLFNGSVREVVDGVFDDCKFQFILRPGFVCGPHVTLDDLSAFDQRAEAMLDVIRIAAIPAQVLSDLSGEEGELLCVMAAMHVNDFDEGNLDVAVKLASQSPNLLDEAILGIEWRSVENVASLAERLWRIPVQTSKQIAVSASCRAGVVRDLSVDWSSVWTDSALSGVVQRELSIFRALDLIESEKRTGPYQPGSVPRGAHNCNFDPDVYKPGRAFYVDPLDTRQDLIRHQLEEAEKWLRTCIESRSFERLFFSVAAIVGSCEFVPILIRAMKVPQYARVAGEAFSMITGVDLAYEDLDADWPEDFDAGPTEDPADDDVEMDLDEDLPWPDPVLVKGWWDEHGAMFLPGQRYLCGEPISENACRKVLKTGFQRQRIAAAYELALMNPSEPLFNCAAPAFRQREWLGLPAYR